MSTKTQSLHGGRFRPRFQSGLQHVAGFVIMLRWQKAPQVPVDVLNLVLPWQTVGPIHHAMREGVRAVHPAALHCHIAVVSDLVDVVLYPPECWPCGLGRVGPCSAQPSTCR